MFQVAYLMCAPVVGQNLQRFGRKNVILAGYMLCIMATVGFGLVSHVPKDLGPNPENSQLFFGLSLAIRFL